MEMVLHGNFNIILTAGLLLLISNLRPLPVCASEQKAYRWYLSLEALA
jgi:hypothetical protein